MEQRSNQKVHNIYLKIFMAFKNKDKIFKVDTSIKKKENHRKYR